MKKTILFAFVLITSSVILVSCGPTKDDAIKYNDRLVDINAGLTAAQDAFFNQLDAHNVDSLKITLSQFSAKSKNSLEEVEKIGPFNEKKEYLDAALSYFKTINGLAEKEAKEITEILSKDTAQITEDDYGKAEEIANKLDSEYDKCFAQFQTAQEKFAAEWKFEIVEDKK
jgi:hypothetical protein